MASVMKTIKSGNKEISKKEDLYNFSNFPSSTKETTDNTSSILKNLFETFESSQKNERKIRKERIKESLALVPPRTVMKESLEKCVEHIKELLIALEENTKDSFDEENDGINAAMEKYETDIVESILRPKLELLSGVIKEIEVIFNNEQSTKTKLVSEIHSKFVNAIDTLFSYIQALDNYKLELTRQKLNSDKTAKMLEQGFLAIKELNDPANTKYSLYGVTKLTKANYLQNLQASKLYLPQEDVDIMIDIEKMLANAEEKNENLLVDLRQKDVEITKIKKILREVQEKSYKDNIELADQCKKLKESLGLRRGNKNNLTTLDFSFKAENEILKAEIEQLKNDRNSLFQELIQTRAKNL